MSTNAITAIIVNWQWSHCRNEDWSGIFNEPNLQSSYDILETKVKKIIDTTAPLRKVVICEKHPISNHTLRSLENRCRTLYKKMKRTKTSNSVEENQEENKIKSQNHQQS